MDIKNSIAPVNIPETKETYEAPVIEIIEVKVEEGFQASLTDPCDPPTY